jgi:malonate transporter
MGRGMDVAQVPCTQALPRGRPAQVEAERGIAAPALAILQAMPDALLLLPDFLLIVLGYLICRHTPLDRPVWDGAERLVYYLLFPALLFTPSCATRCARQALPLAGAGLAVVGSRHRAGLRAAAAAGRGRAAARVGRADGLPLQLLRRAGAGRAPGRHPGVAWTALLVSVCVPLCNVAAVWPLARHGGQGYLRELARNPLILATGAGLCATCWACAARPGQRHAGPHRRGRAAAGPDGGGRRACSFGALREGPGWPPRCWPSATCGAAGWWAWRW